MTIADFVRFKSRGVCTNVGCYGVEGVCGLVMNVRGVRKFGECVPENLVWNMSTDKDFAPLANRYCLWPTVKSDNTGLA